MRRIGRAKLPDPWVRKLSCRPRKSAHVRSLATRRPHLRRGMHAKAGHFEFPWKWARIPSRSPCGLRGLARSLALLIPMSARIIRTSARCNRRACNCDAATTTRRLRTSSRTVLPRWFCSRPSGFRGNEESRVSKRRK